jgi:GntR family transcriptional regulator, transcriptional repressor for pyruvate dehydrogenase complex
MLKPVQIQNTVEIISSQIFQLLREGRLKPGDKLPAEVELMAQLGVGRSSVREAKRMLTAKGILAAQPGKGTFVRQLGLETLDSDLLYILLSAETLDDLQETRDMLENQIAIFATVRATEADLEAMEDCLLRMREVVPSPRIHEFSIQFHATLANATHNQVLVRIYRVIGDLLWNYVRLLYVQFADPEQEIASHWELFTAIRSRNVDEAQRGMATHMAEVRAFMAQLLQASS